PWYQNAGVVCVRAHQGPRGNPGWRSLLGVDVISVASGTGSASLLERDPRSIEFPLDRPRRVGSVDAERARLDAAGEMVGERGMLRGDSLDRGAHALRDRRARAFGRRSRFAIATSETDRGGELRADRVHLFACPLGAPGVVELLRFLDLCSELLEAAA